MIGCKPADTPIEFNAKLKDSVDKVPVDNERYQRLVGKPIYLSHNGPNISYVVSVVSHFMQAPYEEHREYVILRYLKSSLRTGLMFKKTDRKYIKAYIDFD